MKTMISQAKIKLVRSLGQKKHRDRLGLFLVEGEKMVVELLSQKPGTGYRLKEIIASGSWIEKKPGLLPLEDIEVIEASDNILSRLSQQVNPQPVMALVEKPNEQPDPAAMAGNPVLGLESVRDPGNLGTILRTADWFGIRNIVCSQDSVDLYNPKVVQSSMGALFRVSVLYTSLPGLLREPGFRDRSVYGTYLSGDSIYSSTLERDSLILFGNEARGLSEEVRSLVTQRITIPSYGGSGHRGPGSLNLAASVAVVCSEFRRQSPR